MVTLSVCFSDAVVLSVEFQVLQFGLDCILGMPFLQKFYSKVDWVAQSVHVDEYALPVGLGRPMYATKIEMVCAKTFVSELK